LTVVDGAQTAGQYPITITPAAGTIGPQKATSLQLTNNGQTVTLQCDSVANNWVVLSTTFAAQTPPPAAQITSVSISCGSSCSFVSGTAGVIGTAAATLSSGSFAGSWSLQNTGTDHAGTACKNYGNYLSINSSTGAISNSAAAPAQSYPGVCAIATQAGLQNSPYAQAFSFAGSAPPPSGPTPTDVTPHTSSIAANAPANSLVTPLTVAMSDHSMFIGSLALSDPSGLFALSGNNLQVGANALTAAAVGSHTVQVTPTSTAGNYSVFAPAYTETCASPTSCGVNVTLNSTQNKLLLYALGCPDINCAGTGYTTVTGWSDPHISGCVLGKGARGGGAGGGGEIWLCSIASVGAASPTATFSAATYYPAVGAIEIGGIAGDDGVGAVNFGAGIASSVASSGPTTKQNEFLFNLVVNGNGTALTPGSGNSVISNTPGSWVILAQFNVTNSPGPQTMQAGLSRSDGWNSLLLALHP
jgi:hypothetical protein